MSGLSAPQQEHEMMVLAWWSFDLRSELSAAKLDALRAIHYREVERTRQSIIRLPKDRVIKQGWA